MVIAIDGPAGAGKTTVARAVASKLGFLLVDTGAIYRCLALAARQRGIDWDDETKLAPLAKELQVEFYGPASAQRVRLSGREVSDEIRTPEISEGASRVSVHPRVRAALLELQRRFARRGGAVLEGRDIGTVVWPQAEVKVFLDATDRVRAARRQAELEQKNIAVEFSSTLAELRRRDQRDSSRAVAPLKPADDALIIDTGPLTIEQVVERILELVEKRSPEAQA